MLLYEIMKTALFETLVHRQNSICSFLLKSAQAGWGRYSKETKQTIQHTAHLSIVKDTFFLPLLFEIILNKTVSSVIQIFCCLLFIVLMRKMYSKWLCKRTDIYPNERCVVWICKWTKWLKKKKKARTAMSWGGSDSSA